MAFFMAKSHTFNSHNVKEDTKAKIRSKKMAIATLTEYETLETGTYNAEIADIQDVETIHGESWKWIFKISNADEEETEITALSSRSFSPGSKAGRWTQLLLGGKKLPKQLDLAKLVGCICQVFVEKTEKDNGKVFSNVKEITKLLDNSNSFLPKEFKIEAEANNDLPF
jgi:hypothetical protein